MKMIFEQFHEIEVVLRSNLKLDLEHVIRIKSIHIDPLFITTAFDNELKHRGNLVSICVPVHTI